MFVGPSEAAIRAMGLKDAAKAAMARAGVPVVPGWSGADQDDGVLARAAAEVGFPVLIKAVAGGGGKGMRRVDAAEGFAEALEAARSEAEGAFGNGAVLIEKYVETPRHIEVQVFGDGTRAVHLFERDCSLQRRHQKVIEEAPAPGMTPEMREAMGAAAVRAAEAIGYSGAGTVEFIVDASEGLRPDRFWFMEMNTRLQVEHPVTEAVTGVDLVEWQLRVAAGEALPARQEDLAIRGHAVEARLYAEDVAAGFLPATGRLEHLWFPEGVRVDAGVREGDAIGPFYDPMIAKVIAHGADRAAALARLEAGLAATRVAGSVTNLAFLRRLLADGEVRAGRVDTGLIGRKIGVLAAEPVAGPEVVALAAAALVVSDEPFAGFALWAPLSRRVVLGHRGEVLEAVAAVTGPGRAAVTVGGETRAVERQGGAWWVDGRKTDARVVPTAAGVTVIRGDTFAFEMADPLARDAAAGAGAAVLSPMPGLVKAVLVAAGDAVAEGQRLVVLEAMKMEHALCAPGDAVVAEVTVRVGDQVEAGAAMVLFEEGA